MFLELFGFNQEGIHSLCDPIDVGNISHFAKLKTAISDNRELISLIFFNDVSTSNFQE
jgi:hypothetical protein